MTMEGPARIDGILSSKKDAGSEQPAGADPLVRNKPATLAPAADPAAALAGVLHQFGEHGGVNMSIEASSTFRVMEAETMRRLMHGELGPDHGLFVYSRPSNPTVLKLGRLMAAIEDTEAAYCTASGASAIAAVLLQLCSSGGHIVASRSTFAGTIMLFENLLHRACNITTTFVEIGDHGKVGEAIVEGRTNVLYFEAVSNPTLEVADVAALARIGHEKGATVVVDNTFTPMVLSPARLGADVVLHSVSKFISGGDDVIAGAVCGPEWLVKQMMDPHNGTLTLLGPTMNVKVAFELSQRLPHLGLRVKEHSRRALAYAALMKARGLRVIYPGLPDHPQHALLASMANPGYGHGGMLCVDMGTEERGRQMMNELQNSDQFGIMAFSLGYYKTIMSYAEHPHLDISPGLLRFSVGYSGTVEQQLGQLDKALTRMEDAGRS